jgi:hypothetical protein
MNYIIFFVHNDRGKIFITWQFISETLRYCAQVLEVSTSEMRS